jgi:hypothetical protein
MNLKDILRNELLSEGVLSEVDWDGDFKDVSKSCIMPDELVEYLNKRKANFNKDTKDREKFDYKYPFIHSNSEHFGKGEEVDIEYFKKSITETPKRLLSQNAKMKASSDLYTTFYSTSVPTFRGILYDEEKDEFFIINTCPGAGKCVLVCYALRGTYITYPKVYDNMIRKLNMLLNHPDEFEKKLYKEIESACKRKKATDLKGGCLDKVVIRWNDSGDFFTKKYIQIANKVIKELREANYNVESYGYTKIAAIANGDNTMRASAEANKRNRDRFIDDENDSLMVPKSVHKNINYRSQKGIQELKKILTDKYKVDNMISYYELMQKPEGNKKKWNVFAGPKDGDRAAWRKDVIKVYQIEH